MKRPIYRTTGMIILVIVVALAATTIGTVAVPAKSVLKMLAYKIPGFSQRIEPDWTKAQEVIVLQIRLPRVLLAILVGGGLSIAGVLFQVILRNPLADPYIIGVSSGASLGATLALLFFIPMGWGGFSILPLFAFTGAILATFVVYRVGMVRGRLHPTNLILAGVAVAALLTAFVSFLMVLRIQNIQDVYLWLMGSLSGRGWKHLAIATPYILVGIGAAVWLARDLNVYLLGEETAHSLGIGVQKLQRQVLIVGSLIAAACVSVTGVIGFVGLMVPHAVRLVVGPEHRRLTIVSFFSGAIFLLVADTLARTLFSPIELPVGIITALAGGPFFIYLMKRGSGSYG